MAGKIALEADRLLAEAGDEMRAGETGPEFLSNNNGGVLGGISTGQPVTCPRGADSSLRYIRDRINVPRDMSIHAAAMMRHALETVAATAGARQGPPIPFKHRRDQDPQAFL